MDTAKLRDLLATEWDLVEPTVTVHNGGMNSATWWVDHGERRWVAKSVPAAQREPFLGGLAVATHLDRAGIRSGAPMPTSHGELAAIVGGVPVALLEFVPGDEPTDDETGVIGAALARVHAALADADYADALALDWVDPTAAHLDIHDWVRPAVTDAVEALDRLGLDGLTSGLLHTDPAPEAFRIDRATGVVGLIDWSVALRGPLLYDLASAVMYVGGIDAAGELISAYIGAGGLGEDEVERGLATMLGFRWAVQADYFARRLVVNDLTGIADASGNETGMSDARRHLIG